MYTAYAFLCYLVLVIPVTPAVGYFMEEMAWYRCSCKNDLVARSGGQQRREPKSVNAFLAFFFLVNYSLGTGFLTYSYAFLYAGYMGAIPTMLIVTFVCWIHASWVVETMARAQALDSFSKFQKSFRDAAPNTDLNKYCSSLINIYELHKPTSFLDFKVHQTNFEPSELCEMFFTRVGKYLYLITMIIFTFFVALSLSTVAASAWATHIPLNFGPFQQCPYEAFHHHVIPDDLECRFAYYFSLTLFALVVIPLSVVDLKEQAIVQTMLGLLRVSLLAMIFIYCIVKLSEGNNICELPETMNISNHSNSSKSCTLEGSEGNITAGSTILELHDIVVRFDWRGWLVGVPLFTYPFLLHHSVPSLTNPIKQKQYLWQFILCTYGFLGICFLSLGVIVPLWFKAKTQETVTLNWVRLAEPCNPLHLRILSYHIILLPSVQACSAYGLNIHPLASNIYAVLTGNDTCCKKQHKRCEQLAKFMIRLFTAVIPIAAAFGISNPVLVLQYSMLSGFVLCLIFPTALQLQSIRVCKRTFRSTHTAFISTATGSRNYKNSDGDAGAEVFHSSRDKKQWSESSLYMTPYSTRILSHPTAVLIIGTIGGLLFLVTIASLFVQPQPLECVVG